MVGAKMLRAKLKASSRVVGSGIVPILDNFLFLISGEALTVISSDLETTISTSIGITNVDGSGSVAVPAKRLMDLLSVCGDASLTFSISGTTMKINTGSGTYSVECMGAQDFPEAPSVEGNAFTINAEDLLYGINNTMFCVANDPYRPIMSGICISVSPVTTRFAATDAHKMSECVVLSESTATDQFVIPTKAARNIVAMLDGRTGPVSVVFNDKNVEVMLPDTLIVCLRTEGKFPNYRGLLEMDLPIKVEVNLASFLEVAKRISVVSPIMNRFASLKFKSDKTLIVSARDIDFGVAGEETLECNSVTECFINLKVDFLLEVLSHLSGDVVTVAMRDERTACSLYTDDKNKTLLMPMVA